MILGSHHTEKVKDRISKTLQGRMPKNLPLLHCIARTNHPMKGKYHSAQTREKMKEKHTGQNNAFYGKEHTKDQKLKWSVERKGTIISKEQRIEISKKLKERFKDKTKHPSWKGGIAPESELRLTNLRWQAIAKRIRKRDNYICKKCKKQPAYDVHHIIPWQSSHNDNDDNLITLCRSCHRQIEAEIL